MKVIASIDAAFAAVGDDVGVSDWLSVDQSRIDAFAKATERAKDESPSGATIVHGLLTLSLIPALSKQCFVVDDAKMGINYGFNRVQFAPVPVNSRSRLRSELADVTRISDSIVQLTIRHTVDVDGSDRPAAVVEMLGRYVFGSSARLLSRSARPTTHRGIPVVGAAARERRLAVPCTTRPQDR